MNKIRNGLRRKRAVRPREKNVPSTYDSLWEHELHNGLLQGWKHHTNQISYTIEHTYHPDFVKKVGKKTVLLEAKGRFWDYAEFSKYLWIKKALPKDFELIFLFANPSAPMPNAPRRKDGTKRSHGEWASANGLDGLVRPHFHENGLTKSIETVKILRKNILMKIKR